MAITFGMPSLGHTMEKGKIIEWLKQEGEAVSKGEPLVVIETDKVITEVESPADGVVLKIAVAAEEERPIGTPLVLLGSAGEELSESDLQQLLGDDPATAPVSPPAVPAPAPVPPPVAPSRAAAPGERVKISPIARKLCDELGIDPATLTGSGPGGRITREDVEKAAQAAPVPAAERVKISPVARKLCEEKGIDPASVTGTGPGGRITRDDVLNAAEAAKAAPAPSAAPLAAAGSTIPLQGMRGRVAERMFQSWNSIPRVTEVMLVDMNATVSFRQAMLAQWEQQYGVRISLNDLITKAVAVTLRRHPRLNATLVDREVRLHENVNVGVAVNLDEGLIVPVVADADRKDLGQIARESRELAEKARAVPMRLSPDEVSNGTFTITNLGTTGIELFTPIINPPQVAILGVGMVQRRPVVVGDALAVRPSVYLSLVFDHRAVDGVPAANFLQELQGLLEKPQDFAL